MSGRRRGRNDGLYHTADRLSYASGAGDGVCAESWRRRFLQEADIPAKNPAQNGTAGLSIFRAIAYK